MGTLPTVLPQCQPVYAHKGWYDGWRWLDEILWLCSHPDTWWRWMIKWTQAHTHLRDAFHAEQITWEAANECKLKVTDVWQLILTNSDLTNLAPQCALRFLDMDWYLMLVWLRLNKAVLCIFCSCMHWGTVLRILHAHATRITITWTDERYMQNKCDPNNINYNTCWLYLARPFYDLIWRWNCRSNKGQKCQDHLSCLDKSSRLHWKNSQDFSVINILIWLFIYPICNFDERKMAQSQKYERM